MTGSTTISHSHPRAAAKAAIIGQYLKQLKLPAMARDYQTLAREAERQNVGYLGYLQALLDHEVMEREERLVQRRHVQARFPCEKRLENFDFSFNPKDKVWHNSITNNPAISYFHISRKVSRAGGSTPPCRWRRGA